MSHFEQVVVQFHQFVLKAVEVAVHLLLEHLPDSARNPPDHQEQVEVLCLDYKRFCFQSKGGKMKYRFQFIDVLNELKLPWYFSGHIAKLNKSSSSSAVEGLNS